MKGFWAWTIAVVGIGAEIAIATLDLWLDVPHLILHIGGDGVELVTKDSGHS